MSKGFIGLIMALFLSIPFKFQGINAFVNCSWIKTAVFEYVS